MTHSLRLLTSDRFITRVGEKCTRMCTLGLVYSRTACACSLCKCYTCTYSSTRVCMFERLVVTCMRLARAFKLLVSGTVFKEIEALRHLFSTISTIFHLLHLVVQACSLSTHVRTPFLPMAKSVTMVKVRLAAWASSIIPHASPCPHLVLASADSVYLCMHFIPN